MRYGGSAVLGNPFWVRGEGLVLVKTLGFSMARKVECLVQVCYGITFSWSLKFYQIRIVYVCELFDGLTCGEAGVRRALLSASKGRSGVKWPGAVLSSKPSRQQDSYHWPTMPFLSSGFRLTLLPP